MTPDRRTQGRYVSFTDGDFGAVSVESLQARGVERSDWVSMPVSITHDGSMVLWVNYNELTATSLEIIVSKGNHPQMAELFRLVNYNLPRWCCYIWCAMDPMNIPQSC